MSENDCLNPEEHCELHICQLKYTQMHQQIEDILRKEPKKFACANCGVKVNEAKYLCNPKEI